MDNERGEPYLKDGGEDGRRIYASDIADLRERGTIGDEEAAQMLRRLRESPDGYEAPRERPTPYISDGGSGIHIYAGDIEELERDGFMDADEAAEMRAKLRSNPDGYERG